MKRLPMTNRLLLAAAACVCFLASLLLPLQDAFADTTVYTMTAFTNSSESNMYVYQAYNGTNYTLMKGPAYTPPTGLIRDPSTLKHTDGRYYAVYTTGWVGNTIGIAASSDRVNWTFVRNVTLPVAQLNNTWAPEWFKDSNGSLHVIVSLSTNGGSTFQPYVLTALDGTLANWSTPVPLSGLGPNDIDTFIVKIGGVYHAFTKNETTKYIEYATSSFLTGPYVFKKTGNWAGWGDWVEGPALVQLDNGAWRIFFDGYSTQKYYYSDSFDSFNTWTAKTELPDLSGFVRHLTVLKETGQAGQVKRMESFNYPGHYMHHVNSVGRIDQNVTPADDSRFRIVPGLADASAISFESINFPGSYLRHNNSVLRIDRDDASALFRADATFRRVPGLANASASSYQSYNYPDRYIRHYDYGLRVIR